MSHSLSSRVENLPGLSRGRRAVLEAIAWFIWDARGETDRKTVRQIATRAQYAMRATFGHLAALKADGALACDGKPGDPKGCRYRINPAWLDMQGGAGNPCKTCAEPLQNLQGLGAEPLQNLHPKSPTSEESHKEGTRERAPAAPAAPADPPAPVQSSSPKEAPRIVTAAPSRRTPLPDGWQPDPEVRQAALDQGIDPDDIREELADWWLRNRIPQGDWNATFRCFVRVARRGRPSRRRDRIAENDAWVRESVAIVRAAQRGEAAL